MDDFDGMVSVARAARQKRHQLVHRLDGRYGALRPAEVRRFAESLASRLDLGDVDLVIGIPEGGTIPAFAVAEIADLPLVLATQTVVDLPRRISFQESHVPDYSGFNVYAVEPGARVVIVEDEVTTGRTLTNAVQALRAGGLTIDRVGTFFVVDHPSTSDRIRRLDIRLESCVRLDGAYLDRVGANGT
jgi:adenine phosphoribosyltransferase